MAERSLPRVLIVDDQPDMARALARVFAGDAEVIISASGSDVLERVAGGENFSLVICDVMMPGMSGPELFERIRQFAPATAAAFVFTTGGVDAEHQRRLRETGVPCLLKPVETSALRGLLPGANPRLDHKGAAGASASTTAAARKA
jgi:CheY-like chemotaxis protein